ncbi:MAG: GGDEF domain-containing protein [Pseudomonadota bacterium]
MENSRFGIEERLPVILSLTGMLAALVFTALRAANSEWLQALIDAFVATVFGAVAWSIYRYGATRPGKLTLAALCFFSCVASTHVGGASQVIWVHSSLIAMFYLLRPSEAAAVSLVTVTAVLPVLLQELEPMQTAATIGSICLTLGMSYGFSSLTSTQRQQLHSLSLTDALTGAANRRALDEALQARAPMPQGQSPISIIMIDIDFFKRINDDFGHATGDRVLQAIAGSIVANVRDGDQLYRIGGEEFLVLADGAGIRDAQQLGEKLREAIATLHIKPRSDATQVLAVTISLGVAELMIDETPDQWLKRADSALYEAKRSGRNQTSLADKTAYLSGTNTISIKNHALVTR